MHKEQLLIASRAVSEERVASRSECLGCSHFVSLVKPQNPIGAWGVAILFLCLTPQNPIGAWGVAIFPLLVKHPRTQLVPGV